MARFLRTGAHVFEEGCHSIGRQGLRQGIAALLAEVTSLLAPGDSRR
ncbi:hypothetical protein [Streptomyces sp. NPDC101455]